MKIYENLTKMLIDKLKMIKFKMTYVNQEYYIVTCYSRKHET